MLVASVDLMTTPTVAKLAEKLARTIHEDVASTQGEGARPPADLRLAAGQADRQRRSRHAASCPSASTRATAPEDLRATLEHLLALPGELGAERKRRVALIFDEFQEVVDIDPALPRLMRAVFQEQPEVAHVYLGSKRHMMRRLFSDENEPFWRSAKPSSSASSRPSPSPPTSSSASGASGRAIEPDAVDARAAHDRRAPVRHPGALLLPLAADRRRARPPTSTASQAALEGVLRSENAHFATVWDHASAQQRVLLQALAAEPGRALTTDYRRRHDLPSPSTVQSAVTALERQELVAQRARRRADRRALPLGVGPRALRRARRARGRQSSSSSSPARRITIWFSSIVTLTGRWPAQCSA